MPETGQQETLGREEYSVVAVALFELIASCGGDRFQYDYQGVNGPGHIGMITVPGGIYTGKDVCGGYTARLPFQIMYQTRGVQNVDIRNAEEVLSELASRLESSVFPTLDGGRQITKIQFDQQLFRSEQFEDGTLTMCLPGVVLYER